MESFYITGQKRVGKTSLALASMEFARHTFSDGDIANANILWGSFANENPRASLEALGRRIEDLVRGEIKELAGVSACDFSGSLSDLVRLFEFACKINPKKRFVILIDEFDEMHQELYLQGNLAETFFANMRALSRCKNVCVVLVGGENMPYVMERQG
jgi:AAA+ ATPase superfamily predicted ATPase